MMKLKKKHKKGVFKRFAILEKNIQSSCIQ